jgi:hypothetical protein
MCAERYILVTEEVQEQMLEEMRRRMLRLKTMGWKKTTEARWTGSRALAGMLAMGLMMAATTQGRAQETVSSSQTAQPATPKVNINTSKIGPSAPIKYDNKYDVYVGLTYMNFQAGEHLAKIMNFGGAEFLGTYWLTNHLGLGAQYRGQAGTTPVFAQAQGLPYSLSRPLVYMNMVLGGAEYRGPKNQYVAVNYHGYAGAAHGTFDDDLRQGQPPQPTFSQVTGLYMNSTKPIFLLGGSVDYNVTRKVAIRLSPDLVLEHFGNETGEFFSISLGGVYRFGKR